MPDAPHNTIGDRAGPIPPVDGYPLPRHPDRAAALSLREVAAVPQPSGVDGSGQLQAGGGRRRRPVATWRTVGAVVTVRLSASVLVGESRSRWALDVARPHARRTGLPHRT
jgi:hypothetical protein